MLTSVNRVMEQVAATSVRFAGEVLYVSLSDGREANWTLEPGGYAIYWEDLDDGLEVCHILGMQPLV
jgi:hypothetical protein